MIWTSHRADPGDPGCVNITIDGQDFNLTVDDLRWIRDMCIQPAIQMLEENT